MKRKIKAVLLSAFVLPGLGQIYMGRKIVGGILILLVNIFMLLAVAVVMRAILPLAMEMQTTGKVDLPMLFQYAHGDKAVAFTLFCFVGLWGFGILDAVISKPVNCSDDNNAAE